MAVSDGIKRRGFASMDPVKQKEIASKGGIAAHKKGTAHEWDTEEARAAGKKGGIASHGGRGKNVKNLKHQEGAEGSEVSHTD